MARRDGRGHARLWLPALVQQLFGEHGNLQELLSYIRHPDGPTAGWKMAFGTLGNELRVVGPWLGGNDDNGFGITASSAVAPALVTLVLMAGAATIAWRRQQRDAARLPMLAMLVAALGVLATAKLTGGVFVYVTHWWWAIGAVATLGVVWALVRAFDRPWLRRVVTGVAIAGIVVVGLMSVTDLPAPVPYARESNLIPTLTNESERALSHEQRYLVDGLDPFDLVSNGMYVQLEDRGFHVFVEPGDLADLQYGKWRLATRDQVDGVISVINVGEMEGPPDRAPG